MMTCDSDYSRVFMIGIHEDEDDYRDIENSLNSYIAKALIYNDDILNDDYVRRKIHQMIEKKVNLMKSRCKIGKKQ